MDTSNIPIDNMMIVKVIVVIVIVIMTFFQVNNIAHLLDNKLAKIMMLVGVVFLLYYELHLGILVTIAFLMLMIQMNAKHIHNIDAKKLELFLASVPAEYTKDEHETHETHTNQCVNPPKQKVSEDIYEYTVDPKVKPYEVFLKMMTTKQQLDDASNAAFLQHDDESSHFLSTGPQ